MFPLTQSIQNISWYVFLVNKIVNHRYKRFYLYSNLLYIFIYLDCLLSLEQCR